MEGVTYWTQSKLTTRVSLRRVPLSKPELNPASAGFSLLPAPGPHPGDEPRTRKAWSLPFLFFESPGARSIVEQGAVWGWAPVKMIAEYLEHAIQFERMAAEATDPTLKESLAKQAVAYRKLAAERAERLHLPIPPPRPEGAGPS